MTSVLIDSGPGTGKTHTISALTGYLRATNKEAFLKLVRLSDEQFHILDWIAKNIPVDDSTTMIGMSYNKDAATQLNTRTHKSVECRSHHGWGYKILQRKYGFLKINSNRTTMIIESLTGIPLSQNKEKYQWLVAARFLEKLKDELLDPTPENLERLADKYEDLAAFKIDRDTTHKIQRLVGPSKIPNRVVGIDYIDQVWLSLFLLPKPIYDIAIVDEAQDQSPARHQLAELIATHKIYVGDGNQSINAFSGADPYSINKIKDTVDVVLDLKTSFRCPPNVIRKLNNLKPDAKLKGLDKPNGEEKRILLNKVCSVVQQKHEAGESFKTHLIICRYNAPLVRLARRLLEAKIPCRILGDRLIDSLCRIVEARKAVNVEDLANKLDKYEEQLTRNCKPYIKEQVEDKINCIRCVLDVCNTVEEVTKELKSLLKSTADDHIRLATIHKSKGLEAHNVWIAFPPIESPRAATKEQLDQESNVRYVAESRTSCNTYWIVEE